MFDVGSGNRGDLDRTGSQCKIIHPWEMQLLYDRAYMASWLNCFGAVWQASIL